MTDRGSAQSTNLPGDKAMRGFDALGSETAGRTVAASNALLTHVGPGPQVRSNTDMI